MADYNRYTTHWVVIGTPRVGRLPVSAVLDIGDDDSLRTLLRESLSLKLVEQSGSVVLLDSDAQGSALTSTVGSESRK
jgi:ferric-dicitrate binding protein FerR (iron transport regulator)